jgi:hypothetical protein
VPTMYRETYDAGATVHVPEMVGIRGSPRRHQLTMPMIRASANMATVRHMTGWSLSWRSSVALGASDGIIIVGGELLVCTQRDRRQTRVRSTGTLLQYSQLV